MIETGKAQSSFELIAVLGLLFFVVVSVLGVISYRAAQTDNDKNAQLLESVANILSSEIGNAEKVDGEYYREFVLPDVVDGKEYNLSMPSTREIVISMDGSEHVLFLDYPISGLPKVGKNIIRKENGAISFSG